MKTPKLTWSDYKDADGNWRASTLPAAQIRALWALTVDLNRDLAAQAERIAALEEAARVCIDADNRDDPLAVERGIDMLRSIIGA